MRADSTGLKTANLVEFLKGLAPLFLLIVGACEKPVGVTVVGPCAHAFLSERYEIVDRIGIEQFLPMIAKQVSKLILHDLPQVQKQPHAEDDQSVMTRIPSSA